MTKEIVTYIELRVDGIAAEIFINDIPLRKIDVINPPFLGIPIMEYLVNGENSIEIIINPGKTPSKYRTGPVEIPAVGSHLHFRVVTYHDGEFLGEGLGTTLTEIKWSRTSENEENKRELFPLSKKEHFTTITDNRWKWESAPVLELNDNTIQTVNNLVNTVQQAFQALKPDPIIDLSTIFFTEYGQAYPMLTGSQHADEFRHDLKSYNEQDFLVEPFDPENTSYRLIADGRMIECIGNDWLPLVRTKINGDINEDENYYPYPMNVANIDGVLKIVR